MAMVTEFLAAVNQICSERGIEVDDVFEALETAVAAAYKREYDNSGDIIVEMDRQSGDFRVVAKMIVVDKVEDPALEVSLKDAKAIEKGLDIGDTLELEQVVEDFGRIAAQTAKQVIMQKIRESEKEAVLSEYSDKVGEIFTAMMQRMQNGSAVFEIGKAMALMPVPEQVSNEFYRVGERYKVLLTAIEDTPRGKSLIVSRSSADFLIGLFHMEVPEIESGVVEVMACAREAGSRSKMAVTSHQDGVDPIGSCVGQRGMRIANVMAELGEEKIDIIQWRDDSEEFVEKALSPAQVISVSIEDDLAVVKVDEDQLSLAIGKDGQNVRLAAKLTGFKIDIQGPNGKVSARVEATDEESKVIVPTQAVDDTEGNAEAEVATVATEIPELEKSLLSKLEKAGKSVDDVKGWSVEQLIELEGIGKVTAEKIYASLNN